MYNVVVDAESDLWDCLSAIGGFCGIVKVSLGRMKERDYFCNLTNIR
jgi:hypothetical protein